LVDLKGLVKKLVERGVLLDLPWRIPWRPVELGRKFGLDVLSSGHYTNVGYGGLLIIDGGPLKKYKAGLNHVITIIFTYTYMHIKVRHIYM
jgi:hypothetical protein